MQELFVHFFADDTVCIAINSEAASSLLVKIWGLARQFCLPFKRNKNCYLFIAHGWQEVDPLPRLTEVEQNGKNHPLWPRNRARYGLETRDAAQNATDIENLV